MRCIDLTSLLILPLGLALLLGTAAPDADAASPACKNLKGIKKKSGCVTSKDVKDGDLSHNVVNNMAGQRSTRSINEKTFKKKMKLPTAGWVIISASARVNAKNATGPINVVCRIVPIGGGFIKGARAPYSVVESLNPDEKVFFATVAATKAYKVRKGKINVSFNCSQAPANVQIEEIGLTARFVPTQY